ncbi:MAG: hypothetical protein U0350_17530 [Caldilineaceae bacterium]
MVEANINIPNPAMATTTVSQLHRIILANEPRLLREMLGHVFASTPGLEVVAVVENPLYLATIVNEEEAHWLIVTLDDANGVLPPYLAYHHSPPSLMAISADGRQVEIKTTKPDGHQERYTLYDISLDRLLNILR